MKMLRTMSVRDVHVQQRLYAATDPILNKRLSSNRCEIAFHYSTASWKRSCSTRWQRLHHPEM